jgi:hypothetical protein
MSDRLLDSFRRTVESLAPRLRFALWEYRVQSVTATPPITVDAIPAGASPFGNISGIKLWPGSDGSVAVPAVGSLVMLTFAEGDAGKPRIVGLDPDQAPTMVYVGNQAAPFVARVGDQVEVSVSAGSSPGLIITAPNGACTVSVGPGGYKFTGTITSGSAKVQAT